MATKDLIGLTLLLFAIPASVIVCCLSQRARDAAFFLMIALGVFSDRLSMISTATTGIVARQPALNTQSWTCWPSGARRLGSVAASGERRWFWPAGSP